MLLGVTAPFTGPLWYYCQVICILIHKPSGQFTVHLCFLWVIIKKFVSIFQKYSINDCDMCVYSVLNPIIQCIHPSDACTAQQLCLDYFVKPSEFKLIWNTKGVRNRRELFRAASSAVFCHAELLLWQTEAGNESFVEYKKNDFAFRLEWGWKSRLWCLLLNLVYSFKCRVMGFISIPIYLQNVC